MHTIILTVVCMYLLRRSSTLLWECEIRAFGCCSSSMTVLIQTHSPLQHSSLTRTVFPTHRGWSSSSTQRLGTSSTLPSYLDQLPVQRRCTNSPGVCIFFDFLCFHLLDLPRTTVLYRSLVLFDWYCAYGPCN